MNKDVLKIIGQQTYPNSDIIDILFSIANTKSNKRQRIECGGILSTIVNCYQYGVIMGKRQEPVIKLAVIYIVLCYSKDRK